jgi:putative membrane protein
MTRKPGPVLFEIDGEAPSPADAPQVPDLGPELGSHSAHQPGGAGRAMQCVVALAGTRPSRLLRWAWRLTLTLMTVALALWSYDFTAALIARNALLGYGVLGLTVALAFVLLSIAFREWLAFVRLGKLDSIRTRASGALADEDLAAARAVLADLDRLYAGRVSLTWGRQRLADRRDDLFDADQALALAEIELLAPLDAAARREVEAAARQVALITALVPMPLVDVISALSANLRMIRRIAELYGGRSGTLGSWRLTRAVLTHLVATGMVAVGDDMIGSFAGGTLVGKLSRRFGEGVLNGALTARVGVAAIELCRPLPFTATKAPRVSAIVSTALAGLFGSAKSQPGPAGKESAGQ